jgi:hypothetical protein
VAAREEALVTFCRGDTRGPLASRYHPADNTLEIPLPGLNGALPFSLELPALEAAGADYRLEERLVRILAEAQVSFDLKDSVFALLRDFGKKLRQEGAVQDLIVSLTTIVTEPDLLSALVEMICA